MSKIAVLGADVSVGFRPSNYGLRRLAMKTRIVLVLVVCVALMGCHHRLAPVVSYCLPPTVFLPVESAGVRDSSPEFGAAFCQVINDEFKGSFPSGCYSYFRDTQPKQLPPSGPIPLASDRDLSQYRIFLVSGFASACFKDVPMFGEGVQHLEALHGIRAEPLELTGLESVDDEAAQILVQLRQRALEDKKRWILVGYSKGAADLEVIVASTASTDVQIHDRIAALVTVAGMIGGSRLYDQIDNVEEVAKVLSNFPLWQCKPSIRDARSVSRQERQKFLNADWRTLIKTPTYSLTTVSDRKHTSNILVPLWDMLSVYGVEEDSQMAQAEHPRQFNFPRYRESRPLGGRTVLP